MYNANLYLSTYYLVVTIKKVLNVLRKVLLIFSTADAALATM